MEKLTCRDEREMTDSQQDEEWCPLSLFSGDTTTYHFELIIQCSQSLQAF